MVSTTSVSPERWCSPSHWTLRVVTRFQIASMLLFFLVVPLLPPLLHPNILGLELGADVGKFIKILLGIGCSSFGHWMQRVPNPVAFIKVHFDRVDAVLDGQPLLALVQYFDWLDHHFVNLSNLLFQFFSPLLVSVFPVVDGILHHLPVVWSFCLHSTHLMVVAASQVKWKLVFPWVPPL